MPSLDEITKNIGQESEPPVHLWKPNSCGDIDIVIKRNGEWFHEGSLIQRNKLVKLFASILIREGDDYFLITPVEKARITVESTPFVVCHAQLIDGKWFVTNNLDQTIELTSAQQFENTDHQNPTILWKRNLPARINQNVMYQWQIHALDEGGLEQGRLWLTSGSDRFEIGQA